MMSDLDGDEDARSSPIPVHVHKQAGYVWNGDGGNVNDFPGHADALFLRSKHRIMGNMVASVSGHKQQNNVRGPPLKLQPEELSLLLEAGIVELVNVKVDAQARTQGNELSSDDESLPDEWTGLNHIPDWLRSVESQLPLDVDNVSQTTQSCPASWSFPRSLTEKHRLAVFRDLHQKGGIKFGADFLAYQEDPELCHSMFAVKIVPGGCLDEFDLGASVRAATGARKRLLIVDPSYVNGSWELHYTTVTFERSVFLQQATAETCTVSKVESQPREDARVAC